MLARLTARLADLARLSVGHAEAEALTVHGQEYIRASGRVDLEQVDGAQSDSCLGFFTFVFILRLPNNSVVLARAAAPSLID